MCDCSVNQVTSHTRSDLFSLPRVDKAFLCSLAPHARKALDPSASVPRITTSTPLQSVQSRPTKNAVVAKSGAVSLRSSPNAQEQAASAVSRQHRGEVYFMCKIDNRRKHKNSETLKKNAETIDHPSRRKMVQRLLGASVAPRSSFLHLTGMLRSPRSRYVRVSAAI